MKPVNSSLGVIILITMVIEYGLIIQHSAVALI